MSARKVSYNFHTSHSYVEDLSSEPVCPVGGKDLDDGSNGHEDLNSPEDGLTTKAVNRPVANEKHNNKRTRVDACDKASQSAAIV